MFLTKIISNIKRRSASCIAELLCSTSVNTSPSGVRVTADVAKQNAVVGACVKVIAETIAGVPCIVYQRVGDSRVRATDNPLYRMLHDAPNSWQTAFEFWEFVVHSLLYHGNAYAIIVRDGTGTPRELIPAAPTAVKVEQDDEYNITYEIGEKQKTKYNARDVFHVRDIAYDTIKGTSIIERNRDAIAMLIAVERHGATYFKNIAKPAGWITLPGTLSEDAIKLMSESLATHYGGDNRHRVGFLEEGMQFIPYNVKNDDAQFNETRKYQRTEVAAAFRMPLHKINDLEGAKHANIEQQSIDFATDAILPWCRRIEHAINRRLIDSDEYYAEFLVDSILRADMSSRYASYQVAIQSGFLSRNEVRRLENKDHVTGLDNYERPLNMEVIGGGNETD